MIEMFREADLVVLPSRVEGFGLIALEAISAGIPVLVSSQAGISESLREVDGGCDVIVEPNKPEEWARRINEFSSQTTQERWKGSSPSGELPANLFLAGRDRKIHKSGQACSWWWYVDTSYSTIATAHSKVFPKCINFRSSCNSL